MPKAPVWMVAAVAGAAAAAAAAGFVATRDGGGAAAPSALTATAKACADDKASLANVDLQISQLEGQQLPADTARKLIDLIDQLIGGLKEVNGDAKKVVGPVGDAQKKLGEIADALKTAGGTTPPGFDRLKSALGGLADGIEKGKKAYKETAAGRAVDDIAAGQKVITSAVDKLETVKSGLEGVLAYDKAKNGSGQEQIEALKYGFDRLRGAMAVDEVPGLGALFDAYSQALDGMAKSVGSIESSTKAKLKNADEALAAGGNPLGERNISDLYPGLKTGREQAAERLASLKAMKARLAAQIEANECDKPPPPKDPCTDPDGPMDQIHRLLTKAVAPEQAEYDARQRDYERAFLALAELSRNQPQAGLTDGEREIDGLTGQLSGLQRAAASNDMSAFGSPSQARAAAVALSKTLGADASNLPYDDRLAIQKLIERMQPALDGRAAAAAKAGQDAFATATKAWQAQYDELLPLAKDALRQRDNAKAALEKKAADFLNKETAAKQWDKAKFDQFDACFPPLGALRRANLPPPPPAPAPPAAPPPKPPETPPPEAQPAGDSHKCVKQGGLAGAVNDVACKIGGGQ